MENYTRERLAYTKKGDRTGKYLEIKRLAQERMECWLHETGQTTDDKKCKKNIYI